MDGKGKFKMQLTMAVLAENLKCSKYSLYTYLGRYEFSHIHTRRGRYSYLENITEQDIRRIKELMTSAKKRRGKINGNKHDNS